MTFLSKQRKQSLHVLLAGAEIHWVDAEPRLPLQFRGGNPEPPALWWNHVEIDFYKETRQSMV